MPVRIPAPNGIPAPGALMHRPATACTNLHEERRNDVMLLWKVVASAHERNGLRQVLKCTNLQHVNQFATRAQSTGHERHFRSSEVNWWSGAIRR